MIIKGLSKYTACQITQNVDFLVFTIRMVEIIKVFVGAFGGRYRTLRLKMDGNLTF